LTPTAGPNLQLLQILKKLTNHIKTWSQTHSHPYKE